MKHSNTFLESHRLPRTPIPRGNTTPGDATRTLYEHRTVILSYFTNSPLPQPTLSHWTSTSATEAPQGPQRQALGWEGVFRGNERGASNKAANPAPKRECNASPWQGSHAVRRRSRHDAHWMARQDFGRRGGVPQGLKQPRQGNGWGAFCHT